MRFAVIGLSHHTAPVALRERFAKRNADLEVTLRDLQNQEDISEVCVISTCNRVEYYISGSVDAAQLLSILKSYLQQMYGLRVSELEEYTYSYGGIEAIKHLFRVSCSLDSMVLGEPQILGQVKNALKIAEEVGTVGGVLTKTFQRSFSVAKRVRRETSIAENAVSMSFAAVELGRNIFDSLEGKEALLVGAGEMATLAAKHLIANGVGHFRVASRTYQTAEKLAQEIGGRPSTLDDLSMLLVKADIVICSTSAPHYVITKKLMAQVVRERRYRPILFVDIAVPRDVEPTVSLLDNCFVYDVDDLNGVLELNRKQRQKAADDAAQIVQDELDDYLRWNRSQQVVPVIKELRSHAMSVAKSELEKTLGSLQGSKKAEQSVRAMSNAIVNKLLHPVLTSLKEAGAQGDPDSLVDAVTNLFDLTIDESGLGQKAAPKKVLETSEQISEIENEAVSLSSEVAEQENINEAVHEGAQVLVLKQPARSGR